MTHFIATDAAGIAIQAVAATEAEARAKALAEAGPLFDRDGNAMPEADALATFRVYKATPALVAQVEAEGGAIALGYLSDGTACTVDEEEAAA